MIKGTFINKHSLLYAMNIKSIVNKLHPLERAVLPHLQTNTDFYSIVQAAKLKEIEVMRALQWLENKKLVTLTSEKKKVLSLDKNGQQYRTNGLPEILFLKSLSTAPLPLFVIAKKTCLSTEELNACIGILKQKNAIIISKGKELHIALLPQGQQLLKEGTEEEAFLQKKFPLDPELLTEQEKRTVEKLKKRKRMLLLEEKKIVHTFLTNEGKKIVPPDVSSENVTNRLTVEMLKTGSWKKKNFRSYDVEINVPKKYGGKKHFDNEALQYIRQIWLEMGFKEMTGPFVQSAFWDLDALFVPQDHPAREMQDTFYLQGKAKLPLLWTKIKGAHEHGGNTGSTGWQYKFSKEESEKILLRTHTTVLSAQTLATLKKEDLPAKFFAVGKVFRNEALDWKHLFEFYQVDGIVIDPNANLTHLKGYLMRFYQKMGYAKVRMRPAHFPYTEPSMEVDVYHPVRKQWIELGGAGIFRPEVVKPLLGFDCPVLAWGQGMGRIISEYWKINDIRDLYKNDLKQLREMKIWLR